MIGDTVHHLNLGYNYSPFGIWFYALSYPLEIFIFYYHSHYDDIIIQVGLFVKWDNPPFA